MATVNATKKLTHNGVIAAANDIHVITLTGAEITAPSSNGPANPPYKSAGGGPASLNVEWCRVYNPSNADIRYTRGTTAAPPPDPAANGSVDGGYRLPAGATDRWTVNAPDVVVKLTTAGTSVEYDAECGSD